MIVFRCCYFFVLNGNCFTLVHSIEKIKANSLWVENKTRLSFNAIFHCFICEFLFPSSTCKLKHKERPDNTLTNERDWSATCFLFLPKMLTSNRLLAEFFNISRRKAAKYLNTFRWHWGSIEITLREKKLTSYQKKRLNWIYVAID